MERDSEEQQAQVDSASSSRMEPKAELVTTIAAAATALASTITAGKDLSEVVKTREPLTVDILDSQLLEGNHLIRLLATNHTNHGIYLEAITLVRPRLVPVEITHGPGLGMGGSKPVAALPEWIAPRSSRERVLRFPVCTGKDFARKPYGQAEIVFSKLDERGPAKLSFTFRLRGL